MRNPFSIDTYSGVIITQAKSGVGGVESTVSAQLVKAGGTTASASISSCTN
jgi:hypothetical protein